MTRHERLEQALRQAEQDLAFTTLWLAQCEGPAFPAALANYEHFLDWRWDANDRYARALKLVVRLPVEAKPMLLQGKLF